MYVPAATGRPGLTKQPGYYGCVHACSASACLLPPVLHGIDALQLSVLQASSAPAPSSVTVQPWTGLLSPAWPSDRPAESHTALQLQPTTPPEDVPFEAVLVRGEADASKPAPLIVYPHGGPHSAYPDGFFPAVAFLCHLGFSVLLINFRSAWRHRVALCSDLHMEF